MDIKIINVLFQVECAGSTEDQRLKLDSFLEDYEQDNDEPLYEGANALVQAIFKHAKKLGLRMKDSETPVQDFDISLNFRVVEKT